MSEKKLSLFVFIDAFGWEVYQRNQFFLEGLVRDSKKLETILGYSSACDPSIITGRLPGEHRMWSSFFYSPKTCPYRWLKWLRFLPDSIFSRGRVRHWMSKLIKKIHGFTGYFMLYSVPFKYLPLFDYSETRSIWREGVLKGTTVFNLLDKAGLPYFVHQSGTSDAVRLEMLKGRLAKAEIPFAYVSLGRLDALMHKVGNQGGEVTELIHWYDEQIRSLLATAEAAYGEISWFVFTDHGMHNTTGSYDLAADVERLGLRYGRDYVAFYDATMVRVWFLNDTAREQITHLLSSHPRGRILPDAELKSLGVYFEDHMYGDLVFLMHSATQIVPSFMGNKRVAGLHGFHPGDADSFATLLSNRAIPDEVRRIHQIHDLMLREMPELTRV